MRDKNRLHLVHDIGAKPSYEYDLRSSSTAGGILPLELVDIGYEVAGHWLLSEINLKIEDDRSTIILGPNGAGKTLLLRICHGLLAPSRGSVRWQNPSMANSASAQAMVFQRPVMLRRSVKKNIEYAMKVCGIDPASRPHQLAAALEVSGLEKHAEQRATHLSGGEQQRLALARCVAINPMVLFLDEPTAHLDPTATRQIESMIGSLRDSGTQIIMVTHDLGQARRLADRVVFMYDGKVLVSTEAIEFFNNPRNPEAAAFLQGNLLW